MITTTTIKRHHRPTIEKIFAPYRGLTKKEDVVNCFFGATHDLYYLQRLLGEKEGVRGEKQKLDDNFSLMLFGEGQEATTSLHTAGHYLIRKDAPDISQNLLDSSWTMTTGMVRTEISNGVALQSTGKIDPEYIEYNVIVKPGDILYLRMKATLTSGTSDGMCIGSRNLNNEGEMVVPLDLTLNEATWVDVTLRANSNGLCPITIYLHKDPSVLQANAIDITDFSISYLEETDCYLDGILNTSKTKLKQMEARIDFLNHHAKGGV